MKASALAIALLTSCTISDDPQPSRAPLVTLDPLDPNQPERTVTVRDFRRMLARRRLEREGRIDASPLTPALREALLEELIETEMLLAEAERLGVTVSSTVVQAELVGMRAGIPTDEFKRMLIRTYQTEETVRETVRRRLTIEALLDRKTPPVGDAELRAAWEALPPSEKMKPARVRAGQILVSTEQSGREVLKRLRKGESFEALARSHSVAPNAPAGGYLGWFARGEMPEVMEKLCFSLEPEQTSELLPSEYGYHVFKVYEREAERPLTLEEARTRLQHDLEDQHAREAKDVLLAALRQKLDIIRNEEALQRLVRKGL
ncbi:MAG: peptidylprolyl isomerase [Myxococcota bacterium]